MDAPIDRTQALQQMPLLAGLPHGDLDALAKRLELKRYEAGAEIIRQGASDANAYFIVAGMCEVRRKRGSQNRRLAFLDAGDFFGELSIVAPAPRSASVIATEAVTLLVLSSNEFNQALKNNKAMAMHLVKVLAKRLQVMVDEFSQGG